MESRRPIRRFLVPALLCACWLIAAAAGLTALAKYTSSPGAAADHTSAWPAASHLDRPGDKPFLVIFVHPHCPCSSATIDELDRLMTQCRTKPAASVVFVKPPGMAMDWEKTNLWRSARAILGVRIVCDDGGTEAKLFDASTSGQTFLFDPHGKLLFSGGITAGRGHDGDNAGEDAIIALLGGEKPQTTRTPVFGCEIFDPSFTGKAVKCPR